MSERQDIKDVVVRLFYYLDRFEWDSLINEVFCSEVLMDLTSIGGEAKQMSSEQISDMWEEQIGTLDAVHHLSGNYLIDIHSKNNAKVLAHSITTQYKESALKGRTRKFYGTYELDVNRTEHGWRIKSFKYLLSFIDGNIEME